MIVKSSCESIIVKCRSSCPVCNRLFFNRQMFSQPCSENRWISWYACIVCISAPWYEVYLKSYVRPSCGFTPGEWRNTDEQVPLEKGLLLLLRCSASGKHNTTNICWKKKNWRRCMILRRWKIKHTGAVSCRLFRGIIWIFCPDWSRCTFDPLTSQCGSIVFVSVHR